MAPHISDAIRSVYLVVRRLFVFLQFLEDVEVAKGGFLQIVVDLLHSLLGGALAAVAFTAAAAVGALLEGAGVADDNLLAVLVELDDLEVEGLAVLGLALVLPCRSC